MDVWGSFQKVVKKVGTRSTLQYATQKYQVFIHRYVNFRVGGVVF